MPTPTRRTVLAGTAATAALLTLPTGAAAAEVTPEASQSYRWRNAVIGGTGFVTGILFHPTTPGLAYARTDIGGAYRWDAHAARWTPLTDQLGRDDWNLLGVEALAVDPAHPDRLFLALGTYAQSWAGNGAVLRSEDRGATWRRTDLTVKLGGNEDGRGTGERLLVDPRDSDTLWLGTRHDGLLKSTDTGATWAADTRFPAIPTATGQGVTLLLAAGRTVYAGWGDSDDTGTAPNLFRTTDGGTTWQAVPGRPTGTAAEVPIRAAYDAHTRALYVTYANTPGPNGQTDGGVHRLDTVTGTWSDVTPAVPGGADTFGYGGVAVTAHRPGTVVVSTNNRWSAVDTLYRSTDGGRTFTARATRLPAGDSQFQLAATPGRSGDLWVSGKGGGLYRSVDGGVAFGRVAGVAAAYTLGFGKAAPGAAYPALFLVGSTDGSRSAVYRSDDRARTWIRVNDDAHQWGWTGQAVTGDPRIHGRVYLATNGRGIQYGEPA